MPEALRTDSVLNPHPLHRVLSMSSIGLRHIRPGPSRSSHYFCKAFFSSSLKTSMRELSVSEEAESRRERTSLLITAIVMALTCALEPALVLPYPSYSSGGGVSGYDIIALVWYYTAQPWNPEPRLYFFYIPIIIIYLPVTLPLFIFVYGVVRYIQNRITTARLVALGILSIIFPLFVVIIYVIVASMIGAFGFVGPIPIHFLVGALFIKLFRKSQVAPWEGEDEEAPWWEE